MRIGIIVTDLAGFSRLEAILQELHFAFPKLIHRDPEAKRKGFWTVLGFISLRVHRLSEATVGWSFHHIVFFAEPRNRPVSRSEADTYYRETDAWRLKLLPGGLWLDLGGL